MGAHVQSKNTKASLPPIPKVIPVGPQTISPGPEPVSNMRAFVGHRPFFMDQSTGCQAAVWLNSLNVEVNTSLNWSEQLLAPLRLYIPGAPEQPDMTINPMSYYPLEAVWFDLAAVNVEAGEVNSCLFVILSWIGSSTLVLAACRNDGWAWNPQCGKFYSGAC